MANCVIPPEQLVREIKAMALKHAKGDERLAGKICVAMCIWLGDQPYQGGENG